MWKARKIMARLLRGLGTLIFSFVPLGTGLGFIYLMTPQIADFTSLIGVNSLVFLTIAFLFPFSAYSMLSWLAWIVSGFFGGFIFRGILYPLIVTLGYAWTIVFFGGGFTFLGLAWLPASLTARLIILNTFVASLSFLFGAWIGSAIRR